MTKHELVWEALEEGIYFYVSRISLFRRARQPIARHSWQAGMHPAISLLNMLLEQDAADQHGDGAIVPHATIACMSVAETALLGLPQHCPHALHLKHQGGISGPSFRIELSWLMKDGTTAAGLRRSGVLLQSVADQFLVPEPIFSLLDQVERLNDLPVLSDGAILDARMVQLDRVKAALRRATGDAAADPYLSSITIHHATGLAIEPAAGAGDYFEPLLYGDVPQPPLAEFTQDEVTVEREPLLPETHAARFRSVLFANQGGRSHYRLDHGVYVVVDAPVAAALRVVEKVNRSDAPTRAAFRTNPRAFLTEAIEEAGGTGDVLCGSMVEEAMDYGERVLGVREWTGITLSFKLPVYRNWFPDGDGGEEEVFTIPLQDDIPPLVVRASDVSNLRDSIEEARVQGLSHVNFQGRDILLLPDLEETVAKLRGLVSPPAKEGSKPEPDAPPKLLVLHAAQNAEDLQFNARMRDPEGSLARGVGEIALPTTPLPHQTEGISWLQRAYLCGMPGVLLADDMGLGKTFQVLAFLHWMRRSSRSERPILLVAPKKLLENWRDEIAQHLGPAGLGSRAVLAYDQHLRALKVRREKEGAIGTHTLNLQALTDADWVLTTYDTLRDYHFSFGKVRFQVAIYDEAQKVKSLTTRSSNAAKCQQADFTVMMTGTPIENTVADLWSLLDTAWPGFLGMSAKDFVKTYEASPSQDQIEALRRQLIEPTEIDGRRCEAVMLRRFKADTLEGLPRKTERVHTQFMTPEQARVYDAVLASRRAKRTTALQALQEIRKVAFHPDLRIPSSPAEHEGIIAASARFTLLFGILDDAHRNGERVLVFVDSHMGQRVLSEIIRHRYRLPRYPQLINGDTQTKAISRIKSDFQTGRGFDVLLLGPKSAGVGLTLTAANHVVHMERWWNPAVEDQCSDRIYRIGQVRDVNIHLPLAVHPTLGDASYDLVLSELLARKRNLSRDIVVSTQPTEEEVSQMMNTVMNGARPDDELDRLDTMGWKQFEAWAEDQFRRAGFQAFTTPSSGDGGADIVLRSPPGTAVRPIICQCKHRTLGGSTDEEAVHDVIRAKASYSRKYQWLQDPLLLTITNGRASLAARRLAAESNVFIADRAILPDLPAIAEAMARGVAPVFHG
ncbi:SNF2-related protein [Pseudoroseomonas ludipueritiae]|uniref:Restriction endonuclease n=1 Tax=Pseudoroseomonas ludipueritiae TaxID=198093 RepID=A0ABR7R375_9PROT|nr:SNF2-related protein [Pseudoroseomonas ludipueritiae]MBC9176144.1 restriction endonuclease [Pseudoroseomonas ludipueritiae]